jgi:beta-lactamase class A
VSSARHALLLAVGLSALIATACASETRMLIEPAPAKVVASAEPHLRTSSPAATSSPPVVATPRPARIVPLPSTTTRPRPFIQDAALETLLREVVGSQLDSTSVYVKRLSDGSGASLSQDTPYPTASVFKLYVMWEAVRQESLGYLDYEQLMQVTPYYESFELGTGRVSAGDEVTVGEAMRLMMSVSDTPTAVLLQDTIGWENINASLRSMGIEDSGLFYPETGPIATARDLGVLLEAIAEGRALTPAAHARMRALLLSETTDNGLRAGIPENVPVAHKTGLLPNARHDAGLVWLPGAPYVIVVLSDGQHEAGVIEAVARAVHGYYLARA